MTELPLVRALRREARILTIAAGLLDCLARVLRSYMLPSAAAHLRGMATGCLDNAAMEEEFPNPEDVAIREIARAAGWR